jgi:hypothetical protein
VVDLKMENLKNLTKEADGGQVKAIGEIVPEHNIIALSQRRHSLPHRWRLSLPNLKITLLLHLCDHLLRDQRLIKIPSLASHCLTFASSN